MNIARTETRKRKRKKKNVLLSFLLWLRSCFRLFCGTLKALFGLFSFKEEEKKQVRSLARPKSLWFTDRQPMKEKTDGIKPPVDRSGSELVTELFQLVQACIQRGDLRLELRGFRIDGKVEKKIVAGFLQFFTAVFF